MNRPIGGEPAKTWMDYIKELEEHGSKLEELVGRLIETCPESRAIIHAFVTEQIKPNP